MTAERAERLGATYLGDDRCEFLVWAPRARRIDVIFQGNNRPPVPLAARRDGYFHGILRDVRPGARYKYGIDGEKERPDPASRSQPEGPHGPTEVIDPRFPWEDANWTGINLTDAVIYELHVGTFSPQGTFEGVIAFLPYLKSLGVTVVEIMPIAEFPGPRNWGYDGVNPYAAQSTYGGPVGLRKLVNACHKAGLAVALDVVYNHLGPEGNYLWDYGAYFTDKFRTPWGPGLNFDGPHSDEVRRFFIENALSWVEDFHIDALRFDAVHAIFDQSATPFLEEVVAAVHERAAALGRPAYCIAESNLNDSRVIRSRPLGGFGFDSQWNDDFHHALRCLLTGERSGYYEDFGSMKDLVKAFAEGYIYTGQRSNYRKRRYGNSSAMMEARKFVVFTQNHDQIGNRLLGERLNHLIDFDRQKIAAAVTLLSPFIPMLFQGEEYGETAPFQYFISHTDPALVEAVRKGRKEEFESFNWTSEPPDPQAEETFLRCRLNHGLREGGDHRILLDFYRELLEIRRDTPALRQLSKEFMEVHSAAEERILAVRRWFGRNETFMAANFGEDGPRDVAVPGGRWKRLIDTSDVRWKGPGARTGDMIYSEGDHLLSVPALSAVLYSRQKEI